MYVVVVGISRYCVCNGLFVDVVKVWYGEFVVIKFVVKGIELDVSLYCYKVCFLVDIEDFVEVVEVDKLV